MTAPCPFMTVTDGVAGCSINPQGMPARLPNPNIVCDKDFVRCVRGFEEMEARFNSAMAMLSDVVGFMEESKGVIGWHLNGDVAEWDEILPGFIDEFVELMEGITPRHGKEEMTSDNSD